MKKIAKILVTGSNGQLGNELKHIIKNDDKFIFTDIQELDLSKQEPLDLFFKKFEIEQVINCAAFTNVELAETKEEIAFNINSDFFQRLYNATNGSVKIIHISTDYVFNGNSNTPYREGDEVDPLNVYGQSKLEGERMLRKLFDRFVIIRTSWLYSSFGNNFVKSILQKLKDNKELSIVIDQLGTPTYARDLAEVILRFVDLETAESGIYHYSNHGVASWYDFAVAIKEYTDIKGIINPVRTSEFITKAVRPHYSVLDKAKIISSLNIDIPHWRYSLKKCLDEMAVE